jgi:hypothetical protein
MGQQRFGVIIFVTQRVGGVMLGAHKIDGHVAPLAELEKLFNPSVARRRRSADSQRRVDLLDGVRRDPVQLEVVLLGARPRPLRHFQEAVPPDPMGRERGDQTQPLFVILGRCDVAAVMEDGLRSGRERRGHEIQLDERPHANRQKEVDDLIGVEKGVQPLVAC